MKDHVEIGHLTRFDALRVNRDKVMELEIWFKIHTKVFSNSLIIHATLTQPEHLILVRWMSSETQ